MPKPLPIMPASVKVGALVFEVTDDENDWIRIEHATQMKGNYGYTTRLESRIYLNPSQSPSNLRLTLWHEVLHALHEGVMGRPDWRHLGATNEDREESVISAWEHPTLQVLRDNPDLVAYLLVDED